MWWKKGKYNTFSNDVIYKILKKEINENKELVATLFDEYSKDLCLYLVGLGYTIDVEDIVQEAFCAAFVEIMNLRKPEAILSWLTRIALNTAKDRSKKKRPIPMCDDDLSYLSNARAHESKDPSYDKILLKNEIEKLSPKLRTAFGLNAVSNFSYKEIATILGIKEETAKKRIYEAKQILRKNLSNEPDNKDLSRMLPVVLFFMTVDMIVRNSFK